MNRQLSLFGFHDDYMGRFNETCLPMLQVGSFMQMADAKEDRVEDTKYTWTVNLDWVGSIDAYFTLPDGSEYSFMEGYGDEKKSDGLRIRPRWRRGSILSWRILYKIGLPGRRWFYERNKSAHCN